MREPAETLCLVFPVSVPGRGHLLPLEASEARSGLGLRPMALAEVVKEADRPCFALLSDSEELLARAWQLSARCGLKGSQGAITPTPLPPAAPGRAPGPLVNGVLLTGPESGFEKMYEVLAVSGDPDEGRLARSGERALAAAAPREIRWKEGSLRPGSVLQGGRPLIMGILNVTPDSFSDGGRYAGREAAMARAHEMAEQGAGIIDIGGESSRPGAAPVEMEEESRRVLPVVEALAGRLGLPLSIDTTKAEVARRAVEAGASIINDISGMTMDPLMPSLAAALQVPVILNHLRGVPRTMQESPEFGHVVTEVLLELAARVRSARKAGVEAGRIVVDPGIGFGKRGADNLALLRHLEVLRALGCPVLVGVSRKSFLGALTGREVGGRGPATTAAETLAALAGAEILRTHDPAAARDAVAVAAAMVSG